MACMELLPQFQLWSKIENLLILLLIKLVFQAMVTQVVFISNAMS
nr:MAG TPA: hypothetical protein [Bacteriophage sp.]